MGDWFYDRVIDSGRLPLFCFFAGMVIGFLFIRLSVRLIRANVRWWPGNVTPGDTHVHHMVFGLGFMLAGGVAGLALPDDLVGWASVAAVLFGIGTALVVDEFALILRLEDVYWSEAGRISVDAVFGLVAVTAMLLLGMHPFFGFEPDYGAPGLWRGWPLLLGFGLAVVTVLKGKVWTAMFGMFTLLPLLFGAVRLARPASPWARWRYRSGRRRGVRKSERAHRREDRLRRPINRAKNRIQDLIAGRLDS